MLNQFIAFSLKNRLLVVAAAALVLVYGTWVARSLPVNLFPDLNRPTVTIMTEAPGLAPEEVETLITLPIETLMNGATNVKRVRSVSQIGFSLVYVEFDWGSNIYLDRQIVTEKLQLAAGRLPKDATPFLTPISSIMGEIMLIGLSSRNGETPPMELRTLADWVVRQRLLAVAGVSQVINIGGGVKQYQVLVDLEKLHSANVTLKQVEEAAAAANLNTSGGFLEKGSREYLVRNIGRALTLEQLENAVVAYRDPVPIYLKNVARLAYGPQVKRGDGGLNGRPAVIMSVYKQPGANTLTLTRAIDKALQEIKASLPGDVEINAEVFRQANFIEAAVSNVAEALRDGSVLVALVLLLLLLNFRTTIITLTAIPLSFLITAMVMKWFDITVNTMTLGGLAVAIGELVDDAIVDVENVFRRLKENRQAAQPKPPLTVIYEASAEVRNSIVYATIIVSLVFLPLFFLSGVEGRLFAPLGIAYIVALFASLLVSLTVTPALCSFLLPNARFMTRQGDGWLVRGLKRLDLGLLRVTLRHPWTVILATLMLFLAALALIPFMGREFLPPFNEGTVTVNVVAEPGASLTESNRLGVIAEQLLLQIPDVKTTGRRTGRAEQDEHAEGVHHTEIDVALRPSRYSKEELFSQMRAKLAIIPGVALNIGQPISHRLDHLLSGVRAQIAIKLFGPELSTLRTKAQEIERAIAGVAGVVDLSVEKQSPIPQLRIRLRREDAAKFGLNAAEINERLETALNGRTVSQILDGNRTFAVWVRLDEPFRNDIEAIRNLLIDRPAGGKIPIAAVADISTDTGPNFIAHDNVQRRIVIQCNVAGRDLGSAIAEIQQRLAGQVQLPTGYFLTYEGQFESQQQATRWIVTLSVACVLAIFVILYTHFRSARIALQIMSNLPLAVIGGVIAVYLSGRTLSVASLVGFITVFGIASRNGIMMISHYLHLVRHEGEVFGEAMIVRGSLERLAPVLMTALTGIVGMAPLVIARGAPGKELLEPIASVVLGGLISATLLDTVVTPALFYKFGRPACEAIARGRTNEIKEDAVV